MTSPVRIMAVGAAAPARRLAAADVAAAWGRRGGRGQVAVCPPDEDVLTLSAEAATRAIAASGLQNDIVDGVWWGTTRPPFAEGPSHAVLASALGLSSHSGGFLCSGSPHAGLDALLAAADAIASGSARVAIAVAADTLVPGPGTSYEERAGAGAAALVLVAEGGAASIAARVTRTHPFLDRYRADSESGTRDVYDSRLFREEVFLPIVGEVGEHLATLDIDEWSLPDPDGRLGATIGRKLGHGAPASAAVYAAIGDTGAAAPLLGAFEALDAARTVGIVGFGGGRATGVVIDADSPVRGAATVAGAWATEQPVSYAEALRVRGQLQPAGETIPMGVPPQGAPFVRGAEEMLGLLGSRCVDCGTINTPPTLHPYCISCGGTKFTLVRLARRGVVHTFVVNHTMPPPFEAPLPLAVIDLDDGARIMLQVIGDGSDMQIGVPVELVLRRYALERGVPVYGFKARATAARQGSVATGPKSSEE